MRPALHNARSALTVVVLYCAACLTARAGDLPPSARLAVALSGENSHISAAVEFRRSALESTIPAQRAAYHWAAAYEYLQADRYQLCNKMLDRSEDDTLDLEIETSLLRGEAALPVRRADARFFFESVAANAVDVEARQLAALRLARIHLLDRRPGSAEATLRSAPQTDAKALAALEHYTGRNDRKPWLGGLLGLIPGLGYAYSGEYANGLRSLLLNALFIYGMLETAEDDQWGAFSVITFFELTWYSGSIYGGVDSAHRHNLGRLNSCIDSIDGSARLQPGYATLPILSLRYSF